MGFLDSLFGRKRARKEVSTNIKVPTPSVASQSTGGTSSVESKPEIAAPSLQAAVSATHEAAKALEDIGMGEMARELRSSAFEVAGAATIDPGGYPGEYRLLDKRTRKGGIVLWIRNSRSKDDNEFVVQTLVAEARRLPKEFMERFVGGSRKLRRETFACPNGGYELHVDFDA